MRSVGAGVEELAGHPTHRLVRLGVLAPGMVPDARNRMPNCLGGVFFEAPVMEPSMSSPTAPHLADGVNLGTAFRALNHPLRRRVLDDLRNHDHRDVGPYVAGEDGGHSIELQLRHTHLPTLDDHGFVDWHPETGSISRGPTYDSIEPLLRVLDDHQDELPGVWP